MASALFSPIELRGLRLDNRIAVSPMCQYNASNGCANDWHLVHLGGMAMGAAGLLMTEATHVSVVGRITHKCLGLYSDENEKALERVVQFGERYGVARLAIQIAHAGRKASAKPPAEGSGPLGVDEQPWQTVAPSAAAYADDWHSPLELDAAGLAEVKSEFVATTKRAARLGFQLVELHLAHGYLLHQFLSPISNWRKDGYGGTLEGRMRFPLEVFEAARAVWPDDRPMGVRISAMDWVDGGWDLDQSVVFASALKDRGCDFIDVSSGGLDRRQKITLGPGYQVPLAERIRNQAGIPTIAVGLITGARQAEAIIADGRADMVMLARGVMDNPRWAWHAARTLGAQTSYPKMYARCSPDAWPGASSFRSE